VRERAADTAQRGERPDVRLDLFVREHGRVVGALATEELDQRPFAVRMA
jgi:hypothetical protein